MLHTRLDPSGKPQTVGRVQEIVGLCRVLLRQQLRIAFVGLMRLVSKEFDPSQGTANSGIGRMLVVEFEKKLCRLLRLPILDQRSGQSQGVGCGVGVQMAKTALAVNGTGEVCGAEGRSGTGAEGG